MTRKGTTNVRMYLSSLKKIQKTYPPLRGESAAYYFDRLARWLQEVQAEWGGFNDD